MKIVNIEKKMFLGPDYSSAKTSAWMRNCKDVMSGHFDVEGREKIRKKMNKIGLVLSDRDVENLLNVYKSNPVLASELAKDPGRQSFHETQFGDWLSNLPSEIFNTVKRLPSSGKNALYVCSGKVFANKDKPEGMIGKSIDFSFKSSGCIYYVSHKHTTDEGGGQDNQHSNLQDFLREAQSSSASNVFFLGICDGDYYDRPSQKNRNISRKEYMDKYVSGANTKVLSSVDLIDFIAKKSNIKYNVF